MTTLLVFGATGFVGGRLLARASARIGTNRVDVVPAAHEVDITDQAAVAREIASVRPDFVLHLAALTFVPESIADPRRTLEVNVLGTLNVLLALRDLRFGGRLLYVSSGDVYGHVDVAALPIRETLLPAPRSPYAVSKLAAEALCLQWAATERLDVVVARPFNHIGPGQSERFAVSGFAKQVAAIAAGRSPPVVDVGDIDVTRDFCDVEDVLDAYLLLFERGRSGTLYNVCSGVETPLRGVLTELLRIAGVSAQIRPDPARFRPAEQRRVCGSPARLSTDTGWKPTRDLETSLRSVYAYWEKKS